MWVANTKAMRRSTCRLAGLICNTHFGEEVHMKSFLSHAGCVAVIRDQFFVVFSGEVCSIICIILSLLYMGMGIWKAMMRSTCRLADWQTG